MTSPSKRLYLLRHAKAEKLSGALADMDAADHDRPLTDGGITNALALGRWLNNTGNYPSLILCSTARRTRETLDYMQQEWQVKSQRAETRIERSLYNAPTGTILTMLQKTPARVDGVMVIGHNPGLQSLAVTLAGGIPDDTMISMAQNFPPGALAILSLPIADWQDLAPRQGELKHFIRPEDLALVRFA